MIPGRVLHVAGEAVWLGRGGTLLRSRDGGRSWQARAALPSSFWGRVRNSTRLSRRLFRAGFHHFLPMGDDEGLVFADRRIYRLERGNSVLRPVAETTGSRPMVLCDHNDAVFYGEYRNNAERTPVHVWRGDKSGERWEPVWRFEKVRHVHGVFFDPYWSAFWVTTGDKDGEAAIWVTTDGFRTLEFVLGGAQCYRAVQLLFTESHVYFGSDAPDERNFLYRWGRDEARVECLGPVGGSVFYGCKVGSDLFFSTAVEPSLINTGRFAEIWNSTGGNGWRQVGSFKKDRWPLKYFQYGQVQFAGGPGDGKHLWYTPFATAADQVTFKVSLKAIRREPLSRTSETARRIS